MKYKCTCMVCNWSKVYSSAKVDGINCPECGGPVLTDPVAKDTLALETNEPRVMKYRCIECRLIHYDTGKKDGLKCKCGGMLEPLGWVGVGWIGQEGPSTGVKPEIKERVKAMLRVQTTISMGEHYVERTLEIDDISTLTPEERAAIIDGAISPVYIDHEESGPDVPTDASQD